MYPPYYPPPYLMPLYPPLPPYPPLLPYDPFELAMLVAALSLWPQYYSLMIEMYRSIIEAWRRALEQLYTAPAGVSKSA